MEFVVMGLERLRIQDLVFNDNKIVSLSIQGPSQIQPWVRNAASLRDIVYLKVWNPTTTTLVDNVLKIVPNSATPLLYTGQTFDSRRRETLAESKRDLKVLNWNQYFAIGQGLNQEDRDAVETAMIFLVLTMGANKNISKFANNHYVRLRPLRGYNGLASVPVVRGVYLDWSAITFVGTAPPIRELGNQQRIIDLKDEATRSPALQTLLDLYDGYGNFLDHYPTCYSGKPLEMVGLEGPDKLEKVERYTQDLLNDAKGQLLLHKGYATTTVGHPPVGRARYLARWVGRMSVARRNPQELDEKKARYIIWFWTTDTGYVKYLTGTTEAELVFFQLHSLTAKVAQEFQEYHDANIGNQAELTLAQLKVFVARYESSDDCRLIKSLGAQLHGFTLDQDKDDGEFEFEEDSVVMTLISKYRDELLPNLTIEPYNPREAPTTMFIEPSHKIYRIAMLYLTLSVALFPDFDECNLVQKIARMRTTKRALILFPRIQNLLNGIRRGTFKLWIHGMEDGEMLSFSRLVAKAYEGQFRPRYDQPPPTKTESIRAVCCVCGYTFCGTPSKKKTGGGSNTESEVEEDIELSSDESDSSESNHSSDESSSSDELEFSADVEDESDSDFDPARPLTRIKNDIIRKLPGGCPQAQHSVGWDYIPIGLNSVVTGLYPEQSVYVGFWNHLADLCQNQNRTRPNTVMEYSGRELINLFWPYIVENAGNNAQANVLYRKIWATRGDLSRHYEQVLLERIMKVHASYKGVKPRLTFIEYVKSNPRPGQVLNVQKFDRLRNSYVNNTRQKSTSKKFIELTVYPEFVPAEPVPVVDVSNHNDPEAAIQFLLHRDEDESEEEVSSTGSSSDVSMASAGPLDP